MAAHAGTARPKEREMSCRGHWQDVVMIWKQVRAFVEEEIGDHEFDLDLVFWGNLEMFKGKFCSDSWPPRSGDTREDRD